MSSKQVSSIQGRSRGLCKANKVGTIISRISSTRAAIVPGGRTPKLSALALASLPSPCQHVYVSDNGEHRDEMRLIYTASVDAVAKTLPTWTPPTWKAKLEGTGSASSKVVQSDQSGSVPWLHFKEIPTHHPNMADNLPPPGYYRFKWDLPKSQNRDPLTDSELRGHLKDQWISLYNWCLVKQQYTVAQTRCALAQCVLDMYEAKQYSNYRLHTVYLDMSWDDPFSHIENWTPKVNGQEGQLLCRGLLCNARFQSLSFEGLTRLSPTDIVARVNRRLKSYAQVLDLWQRYGILCPDEDGPETRFPLQDYQAVIVLLETASKEGGQATGSEQAASPKTFTPLQLSVERISANMLLRLSPDFVTTMRWPQ